MDALDRWSGHGRHAVKAISLERRSAPFSMARIRATASPSCRLDSANARAARRKRVPVGGGERGHLIDNSREAIGVRERKRSSPRRFAPRLAPRRLIGD